MTAADHTANQAPATGAPLSDPKPESHPQDSHSLSTCRARLVAVWDALEALDADVHRIELDYLSDRAVELLADAEEKRLRILAEADTPGPRKRWR